MTNAKIKHNVKLSNTKHTLWRLRKTLRSSSQTATIKVILLAEFFQAFQKLLNEKEKVLILNLSSKAKSTEGRVDLIYSLYVFRRYCLYFFLKADIGNFFVSLGMAFHIFAPTYFRLC